MNYNDMTLEELKVRAKELDIKVGNIGKEKLIAKIEEAENISALLNDDDLIPDEPVVQEQSTQTHKSSSLLDSISEAIDELEDSDDVEIEEVVDLPIDTVIPVKSITYGGLTYQSRSNNAIFRWNQIGAVEYMTVADLNEMNNFNNDFLNKPLVILMDERAIKKFRLTSVYENVAKINNLKDVFKQDLGAIERTIDNALAVNMRDIIISKVRQMMNNRSLVDINIIRMLERKLQFDLQDDLQN